MIRVLLVDDQTLIRQGVQMLLSTEDDIEVIGQAANGVQAMQLVETLEPDVVLMDIRMPEMDGVTATRLISERFPACAVIILTTCDDDEYVFEGLRAGAHGYLLKDINSDEMAAAIRTVAAGEALIQPSITRKVIAELSRLSAAPPRSDPAALIDPLTGRELDVLRAMARGLSNKEIAQALVITEGTVKNHVSSLIAKLGVRDRTQVILKAQELKLLEG